MLTIACVLKSGGDYDWEYVNRLYQGVKNNLTYDYTFLILTDMFEVNSPVPERAEVWDLESDLEGYWSKLELFRFEGEVLYFDLDTIILSDLNPLIEGIRTVSSFNPEGDSFFMLEAFNHKRKWASGIMAWIGDFGFLYDNKEDKNRIPRYGIWEQDYIVDNLIFSSRKINSINDCHGGNIRSYKHHCLKGIPLKTDIICFHGKPRPRDVNWLEKEGVSL